MKDFADALERALAYLVERDLSTRNLYDLAEPVADLFRAARRVDAHESAGLEMVDRIVLRHVAEAIETLLMATGGKLARCDACGDTGYITVLDGREVPCRLESGMGRCEAGEIVAGLADSRYSPTPEIPDGF